MTVIAVYEDDLILITTMAEEMQEVKKYMYLTSQFKMTDMGKLHYCLRINIVQNEGNQSL